MHNTLSGNINDEQRKREGKLSEKKKVYKVNTESIRIKRETKKRIQAELAGINKKDFGKKVQADALISLALSLVTPEHLRALRDSSLSNRDRLEQRYHEYCKNVRKVTRDEFFGVLLEGARSQ